MTVPPRALLLAGLFAAAGAWRFPLQLALDLAGPERQGVSWLEAEGTIWSGTLRGARWQGLAIGDVHVALSPASLVTGAPRLTAAGEDFSAEFALRTQQD